MDIKIKLTKEDNKKENNNSSSLSLSFEDYILGCISQEVGNINIEACKAQAIAARTNAYYYIQKGYSISDDSSKFQAFSLPKMKSNAYPNPKEAIKLTEGLILYWNNKIAYPASFSSNNGGQTVSSESRWGTAKDWLISQVDPYDVGKKTGHGVGMSQRGALKMAELGFSYDDILKFYYPNTTIKNINQKEETTNMSNADKVKNYALSKVGCGYVWGATGQTLNSSTLAALKSKYSDHVDESIVKKWMGKQVFDCASLVKLSMSQAGISMVSGATSQWNKTSWDSKGTINNLPKNKVCCLYRQVNGNTMQHTGLYLGDGTFVDARGSSQGVLHSKIGSYSWTHWGIPKGLYSNNEEVVKVLYQAKVTANSGKVNMRAGATTSAAVLDALTIGTVVDVIEENGDWDKVVYNNTTGYISSKFLEKVETATSNKSWYIKVECESESDARNIVSAIKKLANAEISNSN